jgi:hypothetical protein
MDETADNPATFVFFVIKRPSIPEADGNMIDVVV